MWGHIRGLFWAMGLLLSVFAAGAASAAYYEIGEIGAQWETTTSNRRQAETTGYVFNYGDDDKVVYLLPWTFLFYGQSYGEIVADSNGNIWFAPSDPDSLPHSFDLSSNGPVIAAWNSDLTSYTYGGVFVEHKSDPERVVVEWQAETFAAQSSGRLNKVQAVLYQDGRMQLNYGAFADSAAGDAGSGLSQGDGLEAINISQIYGTVPGLQGRSFLVQPVTVAGFGIDTVPSPVTSATYTVQGSMVAGATVTASVDTAAIIGPFSYPSATQWQFEVQQLVEGDNNFNLTMESVDGSFQSAVTTVTLETGAVVYALAPYANPSNQADFTLSGQRETGATVLATDVASGQGAAISYPTSRSWQAAFSAFAEGDHNLVLNFTDAYGNSATEDLSVAIDTVPPALTMDPVTTPTEATGQTITGTMEAGVEVSVTVDSTATVGAVSYPTSTTWSVELSGMVDGINTVTATSTDSAGNSTAVEALIDCQPDTDGDGIPDRDDPDIDNDGIPNSWESENGLDPYNAADAAADWDQDGLSNRLEYAMKFDPWKVDSDFDGASDSSEFWGMMVPVIFSK